MKNEDTEALGR